MEEWQALLGFFMGIAAYAWVLARLINQEQGRDRSRGNPDNWDPPAGHHG